MLYEVYLAAGNPSLEEIVSAFDDVATDDSLVKGAPSKDKVHRIISGDGRPPQQADVVAVAVVLARAAAWDDAKLAARVAELWVEAGLMQPVGRPVGELGADPRLLLDAGLGVHPAVDVDGAREQFGLLPAYVRRRHDEDLQAVVEAAARGSEPRSGVAVLVGRSSTGKTRALWEAVRELPEKWRLWHPLTAQNLLDGLDDVAPRTVLWLNEAQNYLDGSAGEQAAARLRELLADPLRGPVLILGTLWPDHWNDLTTKPKEHANAGALLSGHKIDVPDNFSARDLAALEESGAGADAPVDPRLAAAARRAQGGQVTQFLAGAPWLMERYQAARGATRALIDAAMDARRMGAGPHLPLNWLEEAALGYLDDTEYRTRGRDWLAKALAYVTEPYNDVPGILTEVSTEAPRNQRGRRRTDTPTGVHYLLADYLDQHARLERAGIIPPIDFWTAAVQHAHPTDWTALSDAAWNRGLYRDATQLWKGATAYGTPRSTDVILWGLRKVHPTDRRPTHWIAAHTALDDPHEVTRLLRDLWRAGARDEVAVLLARSPATHVDLGRPRDVGDLLTAFCEVGAGDQIAVLLARNPAAHASLDDLLAIDRLVDALRYLEAHQQVTVLFERAVAHTNLDDPRGVATLLKMLRSEDHRCDRTPAVTSTGSGVVGQGVDEQVSALLARNPAAHASVDNPGAVARLLNELQRAVASEQVTALAERAAAHAALSGTSAVAWLLQELREAGASEQVSVLLARNPAAHALLDDPNAVAWLLQELRKAGASEQVSVLLARNPAAHAPLDDPHAVTKLLEELQKAGADDQASMLAGRVAAKAVLDAPRAVAWMLERLQKAGKDDQVAVLLARNPAAHTSLDNPRAVAWLLQELRKAGANEQVTTLAERAAAHASLDAPSAATELLRELRKAGADDHATTLAERAAAHAPLDHPTAVTKLLRELRKAGADDHATTLAERAAAHAPLDDPRAVTFLLEELQKAGKDDQVAVLVARNPAAHTSLDLPRDVAMLLQELRKAGANEQVTALAERAAAHVPLNNWPAVDELLEELQRAGADEQATTLAERLPAAELFQQFTGLGRNQEQFRLGREPDGSPAPSWTWDDLD
ncbi:hypothetical protein AB0H23_32665 [Streptomyces albogriseolus]|uniref:hypothetical protein n=1 Tax=Streptomyces albogriseolus TaxID=1887 RepID=UPI00345F7553